MPNTSHRSLTVDFHETGFNGKLAGENNQNFWFMMSNRERQHATPPWGPGNPQELNRFSYVNNNPLRYSDPSGHEANTDYVMYIENKDDAIEMLIAIAAIIRDAGGVVDVTVNAGGVSITFGSDFFAKLNMGSDFYNYLKTAMETLEKYANGDIKGSIFMRWQAHQRQDFSVPFDNWTVGVCKNGGQCAMDSDEAKPIWSTGWHQSIRRHKAADYWWQMWGVASSRKVLLNTRK